MDVTNEKEGMREWNFGTNSELAKKLEMLVLDGIKTASTGLYKDNQKVSLQGERAVITDSNNKYLCIIEYTAVIVKPFLEVDYEYVIKEGEGNASIEAWRDSHREFFLKEYPDTFTDESLVVCEEFKVVERL